MASIVAEQTISRQYSRHVRNGLQEGPRWIVFLPKVVVDSKCSKRFLFLAFLHKLVVGSL